MKQNVGSLDQKIRFGVGGILLISGVVAPVSLEWRIGILAAGVIAIMTGVVSF